MSATIDLFMSADLAREAAAGIRRVDSYMTSGDTWTLDGAILPARVALNGSHPRDTSEGLMRPLQRILDGAKVGARLVHKEAMGTCTIVAEYRREAGGWSFSGRHVDYAHDEIDTTIIERTFK
jgi:hypothetical protein